MPGTFSIDTRNTFATIVFLSSTPRTKFGSDTELDVLADGRVKYAVEVAATFHADNGKKPISEVLSITVAATGDPAAGVSAGSPVEPERLRLGISAPERNDKGGIRGGKPWYQADAVRPLSAVSRPKTES